MGFELVFERLHDWLPHVSQPLVIAGPCSAESEEQVLETAHAIHALKRVKIFRAGVWKPRTRPNGFEGLGATALPWVARVKRETGMMTTVEVATAKHVEECLKHDVDILWVGARTTGNPFAVQEIADALRGTNTPVMVKNPTSPDLPLWVGALERLSRTGSTRLIAVHRGFSTPHKTRHRNAPMWRIALELRSHFPELPMICDPSHICGRRDLVGEIAQQALHLDYTGLMIETHRCPDVALSDKDQQLEPAALGDLLASLVIGSKTAPSRDYAAHMNTLRERIDEQDTFILEALASRFESVQTIGDIKRRNQVTFVQIERWREILDARTEQGKKLGLSSKFVNDLMQLIHAEAVRIQTGLGEESN